MTGHSSILWLFLRNKSGAVCRSEALSKGYLRHGTRGVQEAFDGELPLLDGIIIPIHKACTNILRPTIICSCCRSPKICIRNYGPPPHSDEQQCALGGQVLCLTVPCRHSLRMQEWRHRQADINSSSCLRVCPSGEGPVWFRNRFLDGRCVGSSFQDIRSSH